MTFTANKRFLSGPGDSETWPMFAGHPHDPRAPDGDDDDTAESIADVIRFLVAAELAAKRGEFDKAREALLEAKLSIEEMIGAEA